MENHLWDVFIQINHVYIGMEDVFTTYHNKINIKGCSLSDVKRAIIDSFYEFDKTDGKRIRENKEKGIKSYYSTEYENPCRAIYCEEGKITWDIVNYNDLRKAISMGAKEVNFTKENDIELIKSWEKELSHVKMTTRQITTYPYARQCGEIDVPDNIPEDQVEDYIKEHFNEIRFDEPELDYAGTDIDIEEPEIDNDYER